MTNRTTSGSAVVSLPSDTEVLITREFAAPRHLVWRAWTEPDLVRRWWGGHRGAVESAEIDLRVGGTWRFVMTANGGHTVAFHGEYRELVPDERFVSTEIYEGAPEAAALSTLTLVERDGRTLASLLVRHESKRNRDLHVESGMEIGVQEGFDLMDDLLATLP
jgi:uncharacterized protein YndB with AHSA1/START domain